MNDHNLDDLIIDNIDPKNSKTKSFLTIIALAIVVLIVAIILTKIILKDPQQQAVLEEDDTELISPELTLQHAPKTVTSPKAPAKTETVKKEIALGEKESTTNTTNKSVKITNEFVQVPNKDTKNIDDAKQLAEAKKLKEQEAKRKQEAKVQEEAKKKALAKKQEAEAKKLSKNVKGYFIQVGSFTQTPSTRFLSVIKNSGFNYHITPASSAGTKKLLIGPYDSRAEVDTALVRVRDRINKSAFVIKK